MTLVLLNDGQTRVVRRVPQGEARREATLRDLIADHPDILPVRDIDPSYGRLVTVAKEFAIPGVGFVDVLLIDAEGRLVVVECKLWRNPQARREVVGQILDYARELSRFGYEDLQRQVSVARRQPGNQLYALACEAGGTLDEAAFVDRVTRDLAAGRFLLLVVGDGIAEGTRRIGEYLDAQPGLAFSFGLVEIAEYRHMDGDGHEQTIVQPRVLAQTTTIERWVIRTEVPGLVVEPAIAPTAGVAAVPTGTSGTDLPGRAFLERLVAAMRFDDPGQPPPRIGGRGWIRVPLPRGLYANLYRSTGEGGVGGQVRFGGGDGRADYEALVAERDDIDREFQAAGLEAPAWIDGDVPMLSLTMASPLPWDAAAEERQQQWLGAVANQIVNSLRPRLQAAAARMAA